MVEVVRFGPLFEGGDEDEEKEDGEGENDDGGGLIPALAFLGTRSLRR